MFNQLNNKCYENVYRNEIDQFRVLGRSKANAERLTYEEMEQIEEIIEELYPDGINEVNINDLFLVQFLKRVEMLRYKYDVEK